MRYFFIITFIFISYFANSQTLVLEGTYQGKNLYVQNPYASSGVGFSTVDVKINGEVFPGEINSSAFEVDFTYFELKMGDPVVVSIDHKEEQPKPRVLNPEVLKPRSTFDLVNQEILTDGTYSFTTKNETAKLPFVVQQFKWNKWVTVGEIEGKGTPNENTYTFNVPLHHGNNKIRVVQFDFDFTRKSTRVPSETASIKSSIAEVKIIETDKKAIKLSSESMYEIYDVYGNLNKKGYGMEIDISNLNKGVYYINYDNKTEQFYKK